jgi:hypothetical protein
MILAEIRKCLKTSVILGENQDSVEVIYGGSFFSRQRCLEIFLLRKISVSLSPLTGADDVPGEIWVPNQFARVSKLHNFVNVTRQRIVLISVDLLSGLRSLHSRLGLPS